MGKEELLKILNKDIYETPGKSYCYSCKYLKERGSCSTPEAMSYHNIKSPYRYMLPEVYYGNPREMNANNDCKYYKYSLWKKILN
ncbi:MAG: hypothetical protein WC479_09710, partial [Candidatus Izemoplasmatales bacterium]